MTTPARALVGDAADVLEQAGVASPRHDAQALLSYVTGLSPSALMTSDPVTSEQAQAYDALVARRASREPLQHLLGHVAFRHLDLEVGPGVFVPRPETEVMAGVAIDELRRLTASGLTEPRAVDLCTGSGAVALALATEVPGVRMTAIELSEAAVGYARRNVAAAQALVEVRHGDMADGIDDLAGQVHLVTANPPYIPLTAYESVEPEVRDHDPALALWSGDDGLDAIRVVSDVAARLLVDGGLVACEHADAQGESASAVFAGIGLWREVRDHGDLAGRSRFVTARRVRRPTRAAPSSSPAARAEATGTMVP